jgi:DNA-binding protein
MTKEQQPKTKRKTKSKKVKDDLDKIFIGKKNPFTYAMAAVTLWHQNGMDKPIMICARGKAISRAADVSQVLIHQVVPGSEIENVSIGTDTLTNPKGEAVKVSSITIQMKMK